MARKVLFIGLVWPEPTSSAAGTRIIQLIQLFLANGDQVHFASAASKSDFSFDLPSLHVLEHAILLNDQSFDNWIAEINPNIVVFDRFMIEEQYGWRVQQQCPNCLRILDTEDLHFLRYARQLALKRDEEIDLINDVTKREIASIFRCDLSLIISLKEMEVLRSFNIDEQLLYYLPFLEDTVSSVQNCPKFEERKDFVFIGNYLHQPNWQTLQYLKTTVWPLLKKEVPQASLHIYGAYMSEKVTQLHNPKENFIIHGRAENARETIAKHRILLAPLRFGAGAKGKFIDAMQTGTPVATSTVGAEGMAMDLNWPGVISDDIDTFLKQVVHLYQDQTEWLKAQQCGFEIIEQMYARSTFKKPFMDEVTQLENKLTAHRRNNFLGEMLRHHTLQSTKYLSLWIEEKNKHLRNDNLN
jgi:glycosyltransferase involved in cell wall biosynthesis